MPLFISRLFLFHFTSNILRCLSNITSYIFIMYLLLMSDISLISLLVSIISSTIIDYFDIIDYYYCHYFFASSAWYASPFLPDAAVTFFISRPRHLARCRRHTEVFVTTDIDLLDYINTDLIGTSPSSGGFRPPRSFSSSIFLRLQPSLRHAFLLYCASLSFIYFLAFFIGADGLLSMITGYYITIFWLSLIYLLL